MNKQHRSGSGGVSPIKNSVLRGGSASDTYSPIKNTAVGKPAQKGKSGPSKIKGGVGIK